MNKQIFYRCACFFQSNIYLEPVSKHVHYTNDEQFRQEYQDVRDIDYQWRQSMISILLVSITEYNY